MNKEINHRLTVVAEYRDTDTGRHNWRIGRLSGILAYAYGHRRGHAAAGLKVAGANGVHLLSKPALPTELLRKVRSVLDE